ncbi:MAG: metalloregulator ArsR/SmtB family transcription factor [Thermoplasmata archaeon]
MSGRQSTRTKAPNDDSLTHLFHALSDRTRRRLLAQLALGPAKVTDLARPFRMSLPAVSKHLRILEQAQLVSRSIDGRIHRLTLTGEPLRQVEVWLDPFRSYWEHTLLALDEDIRKHPPRQSRTRS